MRVFPIIGIDSDNGSEGGLNWGSQHLEIMKVCDGSSLAGCGLGGQTDVGVARSLEVSTAGRGYVLARNRGGAAAR